MPRVYDFTKPHVKDALGQYINFLEIVRYDRLDAGQTKDYVVKKGFFYFDITTSSFSEDVCPGFDLYNMDGEQVEETPENWAKYGWGLFMKMDPVMGRAYAKKVAKWRENERKRKAEQKIKRFQTVEDSAKQYVRRGL